jgi:tetratricopeptide (TPR) repeat protein
MSNDPKPSTPQDSDLTQTSASTLAGIGPSSDSGPSRREPLTIGSYRIVRLIGEGGMGAVYQAEQQQPRRIVALKVIKPGWLSPGLLRRFAQESQALGRLQHPGIAQIYEAGTAETPAGTQPFFAMEFIRGQSLRDYAVGHRLTPRQHLELVAKVADAVHHAHQRGLIHRDLKPGNILVDDTGQPKILDFGVARVTDSDTKATLQTDMGQLVGTLAYMSPEQVLADPLELDTRSDVYALGVILYELLAGRFPYNTTGKMHEVVRAIRDDDPAALSSIQRTYRGDIEIIVAKALEKDKTRRYASAAELAADIRRHLQDEPIVARPPSTIYQLQKFTRRHKALVAGVAAVFVVLLAGIVASTWQAVRAGRAERVALEARRTAEAVNDFLRNDLLAQASAQNQATPNIKPDPDLKVRTALDRAAAKIEGKFPNQPLVEASVRQTIGVTYRDLGLFPEAQKQIEQALDVRRLVLGEAHRDTLETMAVLADLYAMEGKFALAEPLFLKTQAAGDGVWSPHQDERLSLMRNLGLLYWREGKYLEAESILTKTLEVQRNVLHKDDADSLNTLSALGVVYQNEAKYAEAEKLDARVLEIQRRMFGEEHPDTLSTMNNLAQVYERLAKFSEAEALLEKVLEIRRRFSGEEHPDTLSNMNNLGLVYRNEGKYAQAETILARALEARRHVIRTRF